MHNIIAKILVEGDKHFCSKDYGGHKDYPKEVIYYAEVIRDIIKKEGITHYINAGDFSFGRFDKLDYRDSVDKILSETKDLVNGNMWFIKGNHDKAAYGMTEYEYYLSKGAFRGSESIDIATGTPNGGIHLEMKDWEVYSKFNGVPGAVNVLVTHGFFTFNKEKTPIKPQLVLSEHKEWEDVDLILCGHIHNESTLKGTLANGKNIAVHYLPCLSRPAYERSGMTDTGTVDILTVYDDGASEIEQYHIELLPLDVSFDIEAINAADEKKEEAERVAIDVSDVARKLEEHIRIMSDPIVAIETSTEIEQPVKEVAITLLKLAADGGI